MRLTGARTVDGETPVYQFREATYYVVDDEPTDRPYSFAEETHRAREGVTYNLPVFRAGDVSAPGSVGYSVAPGDASPAAVGSDYSAPASGMVEFPAGRRWATIPVQLLEDDVAEPDETLVVSLQGPGVGDPGRVVLTVANVGGADLAPSSRWHHPRHGRTYGRKSIYLSEVHVLFKAADPTLRVTRAEIAFRMKLRNGRCKWWRGARFRPGPCSRPHWFDEGVRRYRDLWFFYRFRKRFRPSVGTRIRNYTAYCRVFDNEGNGEVALQVGRNINTFEVRRR